MPQRDIIESAEGTYVYNDSKSRAYILVREPSRLFCTALHAGQKDWFWYQSRAKCKSDKIALARQRPGTFAVWQLPQFLVRPQECRAEGRCPHPEDLSSSVYAWIGYVNEYLASASFEHPSAI